MWTHSKPTDRATKGTRRQVSFARPSADDAAKRIIAVHAHPDDETTGNGITLPKYAAQGAHITLVTSNLGEEGEIVVPDIELLSAKHADQLGGYRIGELALACDALGVSEHYFLGGPGRYRDSGMMGDPANDNPRCFWKADIDEASAYLVPIIRRDRPQVLLTYNEVGGYGHPDHIQAHRVALRARDLAADSSYRPELGDAWTIAKVYYSGFPRSVLAQGLEALRAAGQDSVFGMEDASEAEFATDDALITTQIEGPDFVDARLLAMKAHRSQIALDSPFFKFLEMMGPQSLSTDYYQLAVGVVGPVDPVTSREADLFAGIGDRES